MLIFALIVVLLIAYFLFNATIEIVAFGVAVAILLLAWIIKKVRFRRS